MEPATDAPRAYVPFHPAVKSSQPHDYSVLSAREKVCKNITNQRNRQTNRVFSLIKMLINVFSDEFVCVFDSFFFCNEAYDTVILSFPFMLNLFDILRCAANSQLLSVVMVFKDSLYGKSSVLLSDAPGGLWRPLPQCFSWN